MCRIKRLLYIALIILNLPSEGIGQQIPVLSNYHINPYLYNPAAIANNEQNEFNLIYRKYWLGFNDAPNTQGFNLQFPLPKNVYLGVNFLHDRSILLKSSNIMIGLGYKVQFTDKSFIKFGLSTGIGSNNYEFNQIENFNDPAIYESLEKKNHMTGQFGIQFSTGELTLSASLPQIYSISYLDTANDKTVQPDQLNNFVLAASYTLKFNAHNLSFMPAVMYKKNELIPSIFEIGGILDYNSILSLGTFYRSNRSISLIFGINIKKRLRFNYNYEFAGQKYMNQGNGTHELGFRYRFGNKHGVEADVKWKSQIGKKGYSQFNKNDISAKQNAEEELSNQNTDLQENTDGMSMNDMAQIMNIEESMLDPKAQYLHYVVIGAFKSKSNAIRYQSMFNEREISTKIYYKTETKLFYVYIFKSRSLERSKRVYQKGVELFKVPDTWIYHEKQ